MKWLGRTKEKGIATKNYYNVDHVVNIGTDTITGCQHCRTRIGLDDFAGSINHYLTKHGYKLLHIGTVTSRDDEGKPWHSRVAARKIKKGREMAKSEKSI